MKIIKEHFFPLLLSSLGLLFVVQFIVACASSGRTPVVPPPQIDGAEFVGSKACETCHESISSKFPSSVHARIHLNVASDVGDTSCESCHGPGSLHVASGGGTAFARKIINPGKTAESCLKCHVDKHAEFKLPHHHPVLEKQMNCVDCHDPHGHDIMKPSEGGSFSGQDASCAKCHQEQTRPFIFGHEALREGCTTCHQPHGSVNSKLLTQRDSNLCIKCHTQVPEASGALNIGQTDHSSYLRQGTCISCHTAVHGSNVHPKLLY